MYNESDFEAGIVSITAKAVNAPAGVCESSISNVAVGMVGETGADSAGSVGTGGVGPAVGPLGGAGGSVGGIGVGGVGKFLPKEGIGVGAGGSVPLFGKDSGVIDPNQTFVDPSDWVTDPSPIDTAALDTGVLDLEVLWWHCRTGGAIELAPAELWYC